jgi:predicted  nucleic acid-binding Zn-ribbon protein
VTTLEPLLALQERDLALDRLRHRRATLAERATLAAAEAQIVELGAAVDTLRTERDQVAAEEQRFDHEARLLSDQASGAETRLYSGEVSSPRELQALQADVEQVRRHQRTIEDQQLGAMERREPLDERLRALEAELAVATADASNARDALAAAEAAVDVEIGDETGARNGLANGLDDAMLTQYERRREQANGVGVARLIGMTCQGCHLTIPATEVDRIRKAPEGTISFCDNCGCILVP